MTTPDPREISEAEGRIAESQYRRAGLYAEIADDDPSLAARVSNPNPWPAPRQPQGWPGDTIGASSIGPISVCRMSDMREAVAMATGDGPDLDNPNIVTVRIQNATEGFGYPHLAFSTDQTIRDICLIAASNPVIGSYPLASEEKTLILVIWVGDDPTSAMKIYTSNDYGNSWIFCRQSASGRIRQPRLTQHPDGTVYFFFRDSLTDSLRYYYSTQLPSTWDNTFAYDNVVSSTFLWSLDTGNAPSVFDMTHNGTAWLYSEIYVDDITATTVVKVNVSPLPTDPWLPLVFTLEQFDAVIDWVRIGGTERFDEFGSAPRDTILVIFRFNGAVFYSTFDLVLETGDIFLRDQFSQIYHGTTFWQPGPQSFTWTWETPASPDEEFNKVTNTEYWNYILTPSTNISYVSDGDLGDVVKMDTHGPGVDDEDFADTFPAVWTKSNERHSVAFPPFDAARDMDIYFSLKFYDALYHNVWFVIDDPTHPDVPIFKADFYVGNNSEVDTHPMDTARGLAMWFCKGQWVDGGRGLKTDPDSGRGTPLVNYHHPETLLFQGYDDIDDNLRDWKFWIHYDHVTDTLELKWDPDGSGYVPFVPYLDHPLGDREYVDVGPDGTDDIYVASDTEKYWQQPRGDLWPRRFYFGCPETKPAIERQSGIMVGPIEVTTDADYVVVTSDYPPALIERLSGALDFWYVEGDVLFRHTYGHGWRDVYTLQHAHCSTTLNGGPDQAEITLLNSDNHLATIYDNLRHYHAMIWVRAGDRTRQLEDPYAEGGEWGRWICKFFGTSDTGEPQDSAAGSTITMRLYSPLRNMSRSTRTQGFTSIEPPAVVDPVTGEDTGVKDEKAMREWGVLFQKDFDRPADLTLPVDSQSRLMRFEDYIAIFAWTDLLHNPLAKLDITRVGFTPSNFTLNSGGKEADLLDDLRRLWTHLGMVVWYDYDNGGILRVWKRSQLDLEGDPAIALKTRATVATPISRTETDWQRQGNAVTTASNLEGRPNMAVARVAPWPDGADSSEEGLDEVGGLASQFATGIMYDFRMPLAALTAIWDTSASLSVPLAAYPYLRAGMLIEIQLDVDLPLTLGQRYATIARRYLVYTEDTDGTGDQLTSTLTLVPAKPFGADA
jgi:hypothetical protein